jgi:hypothetical protein
VSGYAVISPDGKLTWHPLGHGRDVEYMVGGRFPGALDRPTVARAGAWPGRGPLKVIASDVGQLFPEDYPDNPVAAAMITALSLGRLIQPWHGTVAFTEYATDPDNGEVLWPGEMSPRWAAHIIAAYDRAREGTS